MEIMLNTTIVDRRSSKQEVHNHTETNIEASGSIAKENKNSSRYLFLAILQILLF